MAWFQDAVVVLGMHRSGTSALTGALGLAGMTMPAQTLPKDEANERGYWEAARINALNDDLLAAHGLNWRSLLPISFQEVKAERSREYEQKIRDALASEYRSGKAVALKDPRLSRLLPYWTPVLDTWAERSVYSIMLRAPLEVASSLKERNQLDIDTGLLLWARYMLDAELQTRGRRRTIISYPQLLQDWRASLDQILQALGSSFVVGYDAASKIDAFLSSDLRHQQGNVSTARGDVSVIVTDTFEILSGWSEVGEQPSDIARLDQVRARLDDLAVHIDEPLERSRFDRKRAFLAAKGLKEARTELAGAIAKSSELERVVNSLDNLQAKISEALGALDARVGNTTATLSESMTGIATRTEGVLSAQEELGKGLANVAEVQNCMLQEVERLRSNVGTFDELQEWFAQAEQNHARRHALQEKRLREIAEHIEVASVLKQALERGDGEIIRLQRDLECLRAERASLAETNQQQVTSLSELSRELELKHAERQSLKRKHRDSDHRLGKLRSELDRAKRSLVAAEQELTVLRSSRTLRVGLAIEGGLHRLSSFVRPRRLIKRDERLRQREAELIRNSALFDAEWYLERYTDVASAGSDPAIHYLVNGWKEGRDPSPSFSSKAYLRLNSDVATGDFNPLLHYILHGEAEGRETGGGGAMMPVRPIEIPVFGAPAEVPTLRAPMPLRQSWVRSARMAHTADVLFIDGVALGIAQAQESRQYEDIVALYRGLFRLVDGSISPGADLRNLSESGLEDAWFVGLRQLRTRWRTVHEDGSVVRAIQIADGAAVLVGEGLVEDSLSIIDLRLRNRLNPLLFVVARRDGQILDFHLLGFPSLRRGGLHEGEAALLDSGSQVDVLDQVLLSKLFSRHLRKDASACDAIKVDLRGADGTHPLFDREVQEWLRDTIGVTLLPGVDDGGPASEYLKGALVDRFRDMSRGEGGQLALKHDMLPALGALLAELDRSPLPEPMPTSVAVNFSDPTARTMLVMTQCVSLPAFEVPDGFTVREGAVPVTALVAGPRPLTDSDLLQPVAPGMLSTTDPVPPVTLILRPADWNPQELVWAIECLGEQSAAADLTLLAIGDLPKAVGKAVDRVLGGRLQLANDGVDLAQALSTPLFGCLGGGVLLHGVSTIELLSRELSQPEVMTACVPLILSEERGTSRAISIQDLGELARSSESKNLLQYEAAVLWRRRWHVLQPPANFWLARSADYKVIIGDGVLSEGSHVCCGQQSASFASPPRDVRPFLKVRTAREATTIKWIAR